MSHSMFTSRISMLAAAVLLAVSALAPAQSREEKAAARDKALEEADREAFEQNMAMYKDEVRPFLETHCIGCHGPKRLKGDLALDLLDPDLKESTSASRWAVVRQKLELREMPPEEKPQPTDAEVARVLDWIKAEMKRSRRNFTRRQQEINGNKVPHAELFDPDRSAPLHVPPRIRRHSVEIYEEYRRDQAKGFENLVGNPFTPDPRFEFKDMGSPKLDTPTTAQLLRNAVTIVQRQTGYKVEDGQMKPIGGTDRKFLQFIDPKEPLGPEQMAEAVTLQFERALGRRPSDAERERFVALMERNVADAGRTAGVRYALAAVYLLPESIYRYEVGGPVDESGKARLTPTEIAHALAYALTDERAPDWLLKLAEGGELDTDAGVAAAVQKMFDDDRLDKPRIMRFFHEYFEYPKANEVFKDRDDFKAHKARVLVSDTDNLVRWILERDKDVLYELLSTEYAFVNTRWDGNKKQIVQAESKDQIHLSYSLPPDWKWTDEQPVKMPAGTRAGVLTQPAWLVAWSTNQDNHAILRGKWVRERLLGNVVPDIPITVDAQLPDEPDRTLRHRMRVTREEYCWQCHDKMNDVGLPFETFDHFGRWRATEKGQPVDATGGIDLTGDERIDGTRTKDAIEFVKVLARSERVEQVFVRHVFRYFTGRNENPGDGPSLRAAHQAYRSSGGSFRALVKAILSSESFLYRTPGSPGTPGNPGSPGTAGKQASAE